MQKTDLHNCIMYLNILIIECYFEQEIAEMSTETVSSQEPTSDTSNVTYSDVLDSNTPIIFAENMTESNVVLLPTSLFGQQDKLPEFDLFTLLTTSPYGKSILEYYDKIKRLDNTRRNRLTHIITKHIYNFIVKK